MTRSSQLLRACSLVLGLAAPSRLAFAATPAQIPNDHLRTGSAVIATLIQQATEQSHTFHALVDAINASDGIVYIQQGICAQGMRACFINVTMAGTHRILWVKVDTRGVDCDLMGLIGHELRHTIEVLGDRHVTDFAAMYNFYSREADPGHSFPFETIEAQRAGEVVRAEVRQKTRCSKIR